MAKEFRLCSWVEHSSGQLGEVCLELLVGGYQWVRDCLASPRSGVRLFELGAGHLIPSLIAFIPVRGRHAEPAVWGSPKASAGRRRGARTKHITRPVLA